MEISQIWNSKNSQEKDHCYDLMDLFDVSSINYVESVFTTFKELLVVFIYI